MRLAAADPGEARRSVRSDGLEHISMGAALAADHDIRADVAGLVLHAETATRALWTCLASVREADPRELVEMAGRTGQHESRRHRDGIAAAAGALGVNETCEVRTALHAIDELPERSLFEPAQAVARGAAKPLRERQDRNAHTHGLVTR